MNTLYKKQNEQYFINLLAAQRHQYTEGKRINSFIFFFTLLSATVLPILGTQLPEYKIYLSIPLGSLSFLAALLLKQIPKTKAEIAAKIQEQFDTELYEMPWNEILVKNKVSDHDINAAAVKYKKRKRLENWYNDYSNLEVSQAILRCQNENLYWDSKQRGSYIRFLGWIAGLLFLAGVVYGWWWLFIPFSEYLIAIFFPQAGLVAHLLTSIRKHDKAIRNVGRQIKEAQVLFYESKNSGTPVDMATLRRIQDSIFENRRSSDSVPNWFYYQVKPNLEKIINSTAKDINK